MAAFIQAYALQQWLADRAICLALVVATEANRIISDVFDNLADAYAWMKDNPETVAIGMLILVAGVTMVVVAGPGGALRAIAWRKLFHKKDLGRYKSSILTLFRHFIFLSRCQ